MEKKMREIALITGASSTIGIAIAKALGEHGFSLVLHYHNNFDIIQDFKKLNPQFEIWDISADLATKEGVDRFLAELDHKDIQPTVFIHATGIPHYGLIQDVTYEDWQKVMNVIAMSAFFVHSTSFHI